MPLLTPGITECSICGSVITERQANTGELFCNTHDLDLSHPLATHWDSCMHLHCFINWEDRCDFIDACNAAPDSEARRLSYAGHDGISRKYRRKPKRERGDGPTLSFHPNFDAVLFEPDTERWSTTQIQADGTPLHIFCIPDSGEQDFDLDMAASRLTRLIADFPDISKAGRARVSVPQDLRDAHPYLSTFKIWSSGEVELGVKYEVAPEHRLVLLLDAADRLTDAEWQVDENYREAQSREERIDQVWQLLKLQVYPTLEEFAGDLTREFEEWIIEPWFTDREHDFMDRYENELGIDCYLPGRPLGAYYNVDLVVSVDYRRETPTLVESRVAWPFPEYREEARAFQPYVPLTEDMLTSLATKLSPLRTALRDTLLRGNPGS